MPAGESPAEQPDALVGQHLGEYRVHRRIGSGGMGVVYEGEHLTIGHKVAIKLIRDELTKGPQARGLLAEARVASAIRHPGIIDIFGFGHQPGVGQYLIMEYLEGCPLNELIQARAPLPLTEAIALLCEVLDALSAAHAVGVIHRDLKPSNIFVARQSHGAEYIKLLDFGLAKRSTTPEGTAPQTRSDVIVGTPQYMAPEQALHEAVGPQTDLYAVGVIAFELLTGQRPFKGRSHMEIVAHHLKTPPLAPSLLVALPPEVDALILRLLAKEPRQRPGSASEVARAFQALLQPREGSSLSSVKRLSRSSLALPPQPDPLVQEATATLQPPLAIPASQAEPLPAPAQRGSRRSWGAVSSGLVLLMLGTGAILVEGTAWQAPSLPVAVPLASPAAPAPPPAEQPVASLPSSEPMTRMPLSETPPLEAPTPGLTPAARRERTASAPARKKAPVASPPAAPPSTPLLPPASPPDPEPQRVATGILHLVVKGAWADVWVDGQKLGRVPPMNKYTLTSGEHELELRNPGLEPYRQTLVIAAGGTFAQTVDLGAKVEPAP